MNGATSAIKPLYESNKCVVLSQALYPRLSEISCYDMAACAIADDVRSLWATW